VLGQLTPGVEYVSKTKEQPPDSIRIIECRLRLQTLMLGMIVEEKDCMTELRLRRNTGIFGLLATLISLIPLPLYFMYEGAPPQWDILTRVMVSIIGSAILIVFLVGFRLVLRQESLEMEWASTIALVSGLMWLTFSSVAQSMEAGTAIVSKIPIDPTVDGLLAPLSKP